VSTFPFLAVLLCAMGALILFLLVMDRRAKIVASNKAGEVVAARDEQRQAAEQARLAQHQQEQEAVHQLLLREKQQLQSQVQDLQQQLSSADQSLQQHQAAFLNVQKELERERTEVVRSETVVQTKQEGAKKADQIKDRTDSQVQDLGREVERLTR